MANPNRTTRDRVFIVTGSSRGIGRETVRLLLARGARVVMNGRNEERLTTTRQSLLTAAGSDRDSADRVIAVAADVSTEEGAARLVEATISAFGRIDVLINNAGLSMRGAARDLRRPTVEALVSATELAGVYPTVAALPSLLDSRGTVVFVSTAAALWGFPGVSWYSATKAALRTFARAIDAEHRREGLRVTTVFLDFVENDPDKETLSAEGESFVHSRRARMSQRDAADAIVRAALHPRSEYYPGVAGHALALATRFAPRLLAYYLSRSGGSVHRVDRHA